MSDPVTASHPKFARVPIKKMTRDERVNTRPVDHSWVKRRVAKFDPASLNVIVLSFRDDNTFVILDGQNRVELARRVLRDEEFEMDCLVHSGLSIAEEAQLFQTTNDSRRVTPLYAWRARITAGDPVAIDITNVLAEYGWSVTHNKNRGNISAIVACERIYKTGKVGPVVFRQLIGLITGAWDRDPDSTTAPMLTGLGQLLLRDYGAIDIKRMADKLPRCGTPLQLVARGKEQVTGNTTADGISQIILATYNKGTKANRRPDWSHNDSPIGRMVPVNGDKKK